jgi:hypothetical protein
MYSATLKICEGFVKTHPIIDYSTFTAEAHLECYYSWYIKISILSLKDSEGNYVCEVDFLVNDAPIVFNTDITITIGSTIIGLLNIHQVNN